MQYRCRQPLAIREELTPGIGAKRANWDTTHTYDAATFG